MVNPALVSCSSGTVHDVSDGGSIWCCLLANVVDELRSQLIAERKRNAELQQTIDSLSISQEQINVQLAFYDEEQSMMLTLLPTKPL